MQNELTIGILVGLEGPDDFLKVKETLTRIGVASKREQKLYQSCHILHKKGSYYICHFKELFLLDGKQANIDEEDILRRNLVASLLQDWGLLTIVDINSVENRAPMGSVRVLAFKDKATWTLVEKYTIGTKHY